MNFRKVVHKIVIGRGGLISKLVLVELTLSITQLVQILHCTKQGPPVFEFG